MTATVADVPGLLHGAGSPLSFSSALHMRTFRLRRGDGDVLLHAAPGADADGVRAQYLGHWHEAAEGGPATGAPVLVHAADADAVRAHGIAVRGTFDRPFRLGDDLDAVPIPGHTPGSTAFLWRTGPHRVLFAADSLWVDADGRWSAAVLAGSDRDAYAASLRRLAEHEFDVLAPWASPAGAPPWVVTTPEDARARVLAAAERVAAGEDR